MYRKRVTLVIIVIFYIDMLIFTFIARTIHNKALPRVIAISLEYEIYTASEETEQVSIDFNLGIPKEIYDKGRVYTISKEMVNGEKRNIAREVTDLVIGRSNDTSYEVISGLSMVDTVIIVGQDKIQDGSEVYVED